MSDTPARDITAEEVERVRVAIKDLPPETQDRVQQELAKVVVEFRQTGQVDPVLDFIRSLFVTANLHCDPGYRKDFAEAAVESRGTGRDVRELLDELDRVRSA